MADRFSRDLLRGSLELLLLSALADGAKYGYLLQKRVREGTAEQVALEAGTLYPLLHRLEAEGLVVSRWEETTGRPRKWYEITAAGRQRWRQQAADWNRYVECVRGMLATVIEPTPRPARDFTTPGPPTHTK